MFGLLIAIFITICMAVPVTFCLIKMESVCVGSCHLIPPPLLTQILSGTCLIGGLHFLEAEGPQRIADLPRLSNVRISSWGDT